MYEYASEERFNSKYTGFIRHRHLSGFITSQVYCDERFFSFFLCFSSVSLQFLFSVSLHSESLPVPECDISGGKKNIEEWYRMV